MDATLQGYHDYYFGAQGNAACPYPAGTPEHADWWDGREIARDEDENGGPEKGTEDD